MKIIIGLGNPGKEYENTRHNAGYIVLDHLAQKLNISWGKEKKIKAMIGKGPGIILAKPLTYMNESGIPTKALISYYKLNLDDLTIVHDDSDILLGNFKESRNRGSAGHNGINSIISHLGTKDFKRWRIGVRKEKETGKAMDFVLKTFNKKDLEIIKKTIEQIDINKNPFL